MTSIKICNIDLQVREQDKTYLFNARQLCKLVWSNHSHYYRKWQKTSNNELINVGEPDLFCSAESFYNYWQKNVPTASGESIDYGDFSSNWEQIRDLKVPEPPVPAPETVLKTEYDLLVTSSNDLSNQLELVKQELKDLTTRIEESKNNYLRTKLSDPELPLYAQLTTTIVLTFFTWTVFTQFFNFGVFSEYSIVHFGLSLLAAIAFEFGLLIFTVRQDMLWLHISLIFQFIILGVHSEFLKFEFESFEDGMIKFVLTALLPIINKAFSATTFKT
jgi:hypothetical protein